MAERQRVRREPREREARRAQRPASGWGFGPRAAVVETPPPARRVQPARATTELARAESASLTPRRSRSWVPLLILVGGFVLLLYSMQLGSMTTSGYDLQRLQSERNEWRQRNEQLELELAKVLSLAWIEVEAVRRLGMEKAARVTFVEVVDPPDTAAASELATEPARPGGGLALRLPDLPGLWRGLLARIMPPIDAGP
jgi:hypothetical protein